MTDADALALVLHAFPGSRLVDPRTPARHGATVIDPMAEATVTERDPMSVRPRRVHRRAGTPPPANREP
jgi:hypothetical protein